MYILIIVLILLFIPLQIVSILSKVLEKLDKNNKLLEQVIEASKNLKVE